MSACKYYDCGWCYAPDDVETSASSQSACFDYDFCPYLISQMSDLKFTSPSGETTIKVQDTGRLGTVAPKTQLHIKMDEPVQYETPMTENEEEIEKVKAQIKVLEKKLSFLEELEKTKSPVEKAYKDVYGMYPITDCMSGGDMDYVSWDAFQAGYNAAYEEKVSETAQERGERVHKDVERCVRESVKWCEENPNKDPLDWLKPQTPEQVSDGLKEAFREAVKQGIVSSTKSKTLTDIIYRWWEDVFTTHSDWDMETSIEDLVDQIQLWLPKEHDTNSYKWNECIRTIKEKLR